jgi:hypothetical protein
MHYNMLNVALLCTRNTVVFNHSADEEKECLGF